MEEYIYQIRDYLPIKFMDEEANEFLRYLEESYLENIEKMKYQFSFTAFHMLYMTFIYKSKWFLKQQGNNEIEDSLSNFRQQHNKNAYFNNLFDLSQLPEKFSLEKLLGSLRFHINDIGICKNHVEVRNNCSHACGKIYYKKQSRIEMFIEEETEFVEKIQNKIKPDLKNFLVDFLNDNWDKSFIIGDIENWFVSNYLSKKDLEILIGFKLSLFNRKSDNSKNIFQKLLYLVFVYSAQKYAEIDKNIFLNKLPIFMVGLEDEIKVTRDDEERTISTQEIIEENLIPIISDLSDEERGKAEIILNLS